MTVAPDAQHRDPEAEPSAPATRGTGRRPSSARGRAPSRDRPRRLDPVAREPVRDPHAQRARRHDPVARRSLNGPANACPTSPTRAARARRGARVSRTGATPASPARAPPARRSRGAPATSRTITPKDAGGRPADVRRDILIAVEQPGEVEPAVRERALVDGDDRGVVGRRGHRQAADVGVVGVQRAAARPTAASRARRRSRAPRWPRSAPAASRALPVPCGTTLTSNRTGSGSAARRGGHRSRGRGRASYFAQRAPARARQQRVRRRECRRAPPA